MQNGTEISEEEYHARIQAAEIPPFQRRRDPDPVDLHSHFFCTGSGDGLDHSLVRKEGAVKKKRILICLLILVGAAFFIWVSRRLHTFTPGRQGKALLSLKEEQIQLVMPGTVQVSSSCDTAVVFTDTETERRMRSAILPRHTGEDPSAKRKVVYGKRRRRAYYGGRSFTGSNKRCGCASALKYTEAWEEMQMMENFHIQLVFTGSVPGGTGGGILSEKLEFLCL